jgi:hypothetical protein
MESGKYFFGRVVLIIFLAVAFGLGTSHFALAQSRLNIYQTTLEEPNQVTPEISTEELKNLLFPGAKPVIVIDTRPTIQYALAHIPGAINIPEKDEERIPEIYPDKATFMVIYCSGPY